MSIGTENTSSYFTIAREKTKGVLLTLPAINKALSESDCYFYGILYRVEPNATASNVTCYPMIRPAGTADSYEPYYEGLKDLTDRGTVLVWENASPSSSFLAGTEINIPQGYDEYLMVLTGNYAKRIPPVMFQIGEPIASSFAWGDDGQIISRSFEATPTGLKANSGYSYKAVNDSVMVPVRIFGIKGVSA